MKKTAFAISALVIVADFFAIQPAHTSEFIPLGFFPDGNHSHALAVSDDGSVVGGYSGPEDDGGSFSYIQAYRWTDAGGMERLEAPRTSLESYSFGISGNGSTIAGYSSPDADWENSEAFTWNESDGISLLAPAQSQAYATSFDGRVVVGSLGPNRGFRWTEDDGIERLGEWIAYDVSADGDVIVGVGRRGRLVRWTAEMGEVEIGVDFESSVPRVSPDGSVIVGNNSNEAYRWTKGTGVTHLGQLGTDNSRATGTNHDGSIIIGYAKEREGEIVNHWSRISGFAWTEHFGMKPIEQVLVEHHGLVLNGYTLNGPRDISPNGRFIVGGGVNPDGDEEAWLVRLDSPLGTFLGDFNSDAVVDVSDIDLLQSAIRTGSSDPKFDLDHSNAVDGGDLDKMVSSVLGTWFGDANLDGEFNSSDLVAVFEAGQYEDDVAENSTWGTGDWNGDGDFTSGDLVTAFRDGGYEVGPRAAVRSVPEPSSLFAILIGSLGMTFLSRRTHAVMKVVEGATRCEP